MDRFKFRVWRKDITKMVDVVSGIGWDAINYPEGTLDYDSAFEWEDSAYILMQCTGLKDKNGKFIYEGDIVKWDDDSKGKYWRVAIVELSPALQFRIIKNTIHELSTIERAIFQYGSFIYQDTHNWLEIIGNIYENPDLLN